ncbi:ABC transporter permease, partial [Enterobacter cloacae complex sp. P4RS]|uniref:ABC transporter permease n=1 Tax=Enterobacter cloacae complex sp. P4RS TaxID=2779590 RepID=UPI001D0BF1A3
CGLMVAISGWGIGGILAILRLRFRDFRHLIPLLLQGIFYLTPVVWTPGSISIAWSKVLMLNPLTGSLLWFRFALLGGVQPDVMQLVASACCTLVLMVMGYYCFVRYEMGITDKE